MKKMFTLFASVLLVASAMAQYNPGYQKGYDNNRDQAYNNSRGGGNDNRYDNDRRRDYFYERDMKAAQINRDYDRKINSVKNNWYMNRGKKERIICSLEDQRRDDLKMLYNRYSRPDRDDNRKHW